MATGFGTIEPADQQTLRDYINGTWDGCAALTTSLLPGKIIAPKLPRLKPKAKPAAAGGGGGSAPTSPSKPKKAKAKAKSACLGTERDVS
jgi:hypothetical protein